MYVRGWFRKKTRIEEKNCIHEFADGFILCFSSRIKIYERWCIEIIYTSDYSVGRDKRKKIEKETERERERSESVESLTKERECAFINWTVNHTVRTQKRVRRVP